MVAPLFAEAGRLGMPAVGMTDTATCYGADEFYRQAEKTGIKPNHIGHRGLHRARQPLPQEGPVFWGPVPPTRAPTNSGEGGDVSGGGAYTHMTMLAENATGLRKPFQIVLRGELYRFLPKTENGTGI